jgi:hypothetical protein
MFAAMVVTWTHPMTGREAKALEYGAEVADFWGKRAAEGKCSEPELLFSERGTGLWMVKGDRDVLQKIHDTDEARLLTMKGELLLEGFSLDFCYAGDDAVDYMARYGSALAAIS